jgi:hypothetical protein
MDSDIAQDVMGLPQVLGREKSIFMAILLTFLGLLDLAFAVSGT